MCGIHLIVDKNSSLNDTPIRNMLEATHYRGPDHSSFTSIQWDDCTIYVGVNQLRITDPTENNIQPVIRNSNGNKLILAHNGEIYNYHDLRNSLIHTGTVFQTTSDTEVLLWHLAKEDAAGIKHLKGMFTFIYLDDSSRRLLLARDPWGMKPLYYYEDEDYLIVSSEIRGILATNHVHEDLNEQAVNEYLRFKYVIRPGTFFRGIYEFEPGTYRHVKYAKDSRLLNDLNLIRDDHKTDIPVPDNGQLVAHTEVLIKDAVATHVIPEQNPALFLSGGVDSTLLLSLIAELGIRDFPTYSFVNETPSGKGATSDRGYARLAARKYQASHHEFLVEPNSLDDLDTYISDMDQPIADSAEYLTFLLCQEAVKKHRVVLSGAGADEVFGGYNRHWAYYQYLKRPSLFLALRKPALYLSAFLNKWDSQKSRWIRQFFDGLQSSPGETYMRFVSMQDFGNPEIRTADVFDMKQDYLEGALTFDRTHYLPSDVLAVSDRGSMRAGVEMRMPYLDRDLTNFILNLPGERLLGKGQKWVLKEILRKKGGMKFCQRRKEGFGLPFGNWVDRNHQVDLWSFLDNQNFILFKFVERARVREVLEKHQRRSMDKGPELWGLLILAKWLDLHFGV